MWPEGMDFSMFSPWELINTMDQLKLENRALANQIGLGLDNMGYTRDIITQAAVTGSPMPPPMKLGGPELGGDYVGQPSGSPHMPYPPVPQTGTPVPPQYNVAAGMGSEAPDMTSAAPSFVPPASLGGLAMPTEAPPMPGAPMQTASVNPAGAQYGPPAPGVDPRTQALRAMAANQGIKMPKEPQSERPDIRQAPPPPKQGDVKVGTPAIMMLLQAALGGGGGPQNPLRVPTLGALVGRR